MITPILLIGLVVMLQANKSYNDVQLMFMQCLVLSTADYTVTRPLVSWRA